MVANAHGNEDEYTLEHGYDVTVPRTTDAQRRRAADVDMYSPQYDVVEAPVGRTYHF